MSVQNELKTQLKEDYKNLLSSLEDYGYKIESIPQNLTAIKDEGSAIAVAYPIQGILKYHGLDNEALRTAYFSSISLNNDSAYTITSLEFNKKLDKDILILNGHVEESNSKAYKRVHHQLSKIREISGINTKYRVISRNIITSSDKENEITTVVGKGLGTSASAGASIAEAATFIIYNNEKDYVDNQRLKSIFARYLAGSASRSVVGGIGIWVNYPGVGNYESFAINLIDIHELEQLGLITVSLQLNVKTDEAHKIAPNSPFFISWLKTRNDKITNFLKDIKNPESDLVDIVGKYSEYDTLALHAITMTSDFEEPMILWKPETVSIIEKINELRKNNIPAYYSIDTGPSVVIITEKKNIPKVLTSINEIKQNFEISVGGFGGPSHCIPEDDKRVKVLQRDLKQ